MSNTPLPPQQILIVDDDSDSIRALSRILAGIGKLRFATTGEDALASIRALQPDLVLLDAQMPGINGFQVCEAMKAYPVLAAVPVILVTSHGGAAFKEEVLRAGAVDFICKPGHPALVRARVMAQLGFKRRSDALRVVSATDLLTGAANRRRFDELLDGEFRSAQRHGRPLALLLIDLDEFKRYNDLYGHPAGDTCLRRVADAVAAARQRGGDVLARYGGEAFALVLPDTGRTGAEHVAPRVLDRVAALAIPHEASSVALQVTVSIGIGIYDHHSAAWIDDRRASDVAAPAPSDAGIACGRLLRAADRALYAAKAGGRARLLGIAAAADRPAAHAPSRPRASRLQRGRPECA